jgi:hypothetical protein
VTCKRSIQMPIDRVDKVSGEIDKIAIFKAI